MGLKALAHICKKPYGKLIQKNIREGRNVLEGIDADNDTYVVGRVKDHKRQKSEVGQDKSLEDLISRSEESDKNEDNPQQEDQANAEDNQEDLASSQANIEKERDDA